MRWLVVRVVFVGGITMVVRVARRARGACAAVVV